MKEKKTQSLFQSLKYFSRENISGKARSIGLNHTSLNRSAICLSAVRLGRWRTGEVVSPHIVPGMQRLYIYFNEGKTVGI
jgi:hypothetical protein